MQKLKSLSLLAVALMVLTVAHVSRAASDPVQVTVTVLPLQSLAESIGGDRVNVTVMVPPGVHPKTFEPTPMQMAALESADLYVSMGIPHEQNWKPQVMAARPDMPILHLIDTVDTRRIVKQTKEGKKEKPDPHIWLGPKQLRTMVTSLRNALTELSPEDAETFTSNAQNWLDRLDAADQQAQAMLSPYAGKAFLVFHPAYGYFADAYQLRQIAIEKQGMEPGPKMIAKSIELARAEDIKTVFVQANFSEDEARTIATEIDGKVVALDPLGPDPIVTIGNIAKAIGTSMK